MSFRAQRSARMLDENGRLTFEKIIELKHSTRMELADRILDDLVRAVESNGDDSAREAMKVLSRWDRCADAGSRGAVLFEEFFRQLSRRSAGKGPFADRWNEREPRTTPDGLADAKTASAALVSAAASVRSRYGSIDVPWGEVYRLRSGNLDLPANGGPGSLGIFRAAGFEPAPDGKSVASGGDSYVAVIEFGNQPRAQALIGYGNSSQPGSKHRSDQLEFFARKQLRPVFRTRIEIEKHLESRERIH
jgi:acyl-homoserine-lactone acylase